MKKPNLRKLSKSDLAVKADHTGNRDSVLREGATSSDYITLFTDGSWCPDTKAYGCAYWVRIGGASPITRGWGGGYQRVSQDAEKEAITVAIDHLMERPDLEDYVVVLQFDCLTIVEGLRATHIDPLRKRCRYLSLKHVRSHTSSKSNRSKVNMLVDELAKSHMIIHRNYNKRM